MALLSRRDATLRVTADLNLLLHTNRIWIRIGHDFQASRSRLKSQIVCHSVKRWVLLVELATAEYDPSSDKWASLMTTHCVETTSRLPYRWYGPTAIYCRTERGCQYGMVESKRKKIKI